MYNSPQRKLSYGIAAASIIIPLVVMLIWDIETGVVLLLLGLYIARRAVLWAGRDNVKAVSDSELAKFNRHESERARTILVQVVDDNGYDLSPAVVEQKMKEAKMQAGPRDTVVAVRHKVS